MFRNNSSLIQLKKLETQIKDLEQVTDVLETIKGMETIEEVRQYIETKHDNVKYMVSTMTKKYIIKYVQIYGDLPRNINGIDCETYYI